MLDENSSTLLDYSRSTIDSIFEYFEEHDVATVESGQRLETLQTIFRDEKSTVRSSLTSHLVHYHDISKIFTKVWKGLMETVPSGPAFSDIDSEKKWDDDGTRKDEKPDNGSVCATKHPAEEYSTADADQGYGNPDANVDTSDPEVDPASRHTLLISNARLLLVTLMGLTDDSNDVCREFGQTGCLEMLFDGLKTQQLPDDVTCDVISVIANCCRRIPENRDLCRAAIDILQDLANCSDPEMQADAYLVLSYIVEKSESHKLRLNRSCVEFLLGVLDQALEGPARRAYKYSALEITQGIHQLSINDNNKRLIVEYGGLLLLERMICEGDSTDEEILHVVKGVWQLAFLPENRAKIRQRSHLISGTLSALSYKRYF